MYPEFITNKKNDYIHMLKYFREYSDKEIDNNKNDMCDNTNIYFNKEKYGLNRISKTTSDLERCLQLMSWTFYALLFPVYSDYNGDMFVEDILNFCKTEKKTVNCLCHATVLTDILLAFGFRAKRISCLPFDILYQDNHVVTEAFIPSINKWIMLDPSLCVYIKDKNQNILSIREIRTALIKDDDLQICTYSRFFNIHAPSGSVFEPKEYITYLYKNYFRFMYCINREKNIFYMLVPQNYLPTNTIKTDWIDGKKAVVYMTDNDDFFWGL